MRWGRDIRGAAWWHHPSGPSWKEPWHQQEAGSGTGEGTAVGWPGGGDNPAAWLEQDWLIFPWQGRGVAICDRTFPGPLVLSKENKQGVVCMGRLASPGPGYGFLLFLAGIAGDSPACPDLASFSLLFFFFF